jgi:hypothetical protein
MTKKLHVPKNAQGNGIGFPSWEKKAIFGAAEKLLRIMANGEYVERKPSNAMDINAFCAVAQIEFRFIISIRTDTVNPMP